MIVEISLDEAEHLLKWNTGFSCCSHPSHAVNPANPTPTECKLAESAREKVLQAIEVNSISRI